MDYNSLAACTLYIKRVDPERLNSDAQVQALRERLYLIAEELETHPVDIIVKRSLKRKGQAFIVYADPSEAATAKDLLDGFEFTPGGRTLVCELARTPSDAVVKRFCSEEQYNEHLKKRKYEKERRQAAEDAEQQAQKRAAPEDATSGQPLKAHKPAVKQAVVPDEYLPPNNVLFVREIPDEYDEDALVAMFSRYAGFKEVRMINAGRFAGNAFVEYDGNDGAISAREALNGRTVGAKTMKVTYQKAG
ncbi:U1 small nuclear ribonucleo protein [Venturia nashicola]|uniref:U1 small nuclear ribonucleo protein n=1 Tax=Venturia nashicola TaxID=86259 RepID=A0A4Z1PJN0_9PEZI|nr:U1 small nuclear ribonucleo protein [Venturia nashicola]TLD37929.1 U1 small nuclear ribonucleo protein [Venturia nashicola]